MPGPRMKKWLFLFTICLCSLAYTSPIQDHEINKTALCQLASALDIPQDADIVAETQKRWLRKPNQERWEISELSPDQKEIVLNWATEQGLFAPWNPLYKTYDKAFILGATTSRMQLRLDHLIQLWNQGMRFSEIVWLTGDRPLDPRVDGLLGRCNNESEAARILWQETPLPEDMRHLPVSFIAVPMKVQDALLKRPSTEDTLIAWLETSPKPCRALFVSDQPFCGYQFSVIKATLPSAFQFDVVGPGADPTSHPAAAAITLDCIARWIYQERLIANKVL